MHYYYDEHTHRRIEYCSQEGEAAAASPQISILFNPPSKHMWQYIHVIVPHGVKGVVGENKCNLSKLYKEY